MTTKPPCACRDIDFFRRPGPDGKQPTEVHERIHRVIDLLYAAQRRCGAGTSYPNGYHETTCRDRAMRELHRLEYQAGAEALALEDAQREAAS